MKILRAKYILTPDIILRDQAVAFNKKIIAIDSFDNLLQDYPNATVYDYSDSLLLPTFANPHIHLEFSANEATLSYGDFISWLNSVIAHRERLLQRCNEECIQSAIDTLINSGTSAIGEISSYGEEMEVLAKSPLYVRFFNEVIGSNPAVVDAMYASFLERFARSKKLQSRRFRADIAIHAPYSVHYILAKKVLEIAQREECLVSVHFAESMAERQWLDSGKGEFLKFFKKFLNQSKPINEPIRFLELFKNTKNLFVHMVWAKEEEWKLIKSFQSAIIHCPISNRLLGNGVLDLQKVSPLPYTIATDGLSSNYSLNMYEELKAALFVHPNKDATLFAKELLINATKTAHQILGFEGGEISIGKPASMQVVAIPKDLEHLEEIYLHTILHTTSLLKVFIDGKAYK